MSISHPDGKKKKDVYHALFHKRSQLAWAEIERLYDEYLYDAKMPTVLEPGWFMIIQYDIRSGMSVPLCAGSLVAFRALTLHRGGRSPFYHFMPCSALIWYIC